MADPFTAGRGGTLLTERIKFLYSQAGEVLKRWRGRREKGGARVREAKLRPPDGLLEGAVEPVEPQDDCADRLEGELREARRLLADYAEGVEVPRPGDYLVIEQADALRRLLEAVYGQRITFKGENRPPSGPLVTGEVDVEQVAGDVAAVRAKSVSSGEVKGSAKVERLEQGGKLTGVDVDSIGDGSEEEPTGRWRVGGTHPVGEPAPVTVTEDGVAPETIAEPELEQRYLQGRFPERVRLGEVVSLLLRLGLSADDARSSRLRPFSVSSQGTDITLALLESPGFKPRSQRAALRVFPGRDSDWALFDLEAVTEGVHTLRVLAFAGGTALGELTVQATVDSTVATSAMTEHATPAGGAPRDPGEVSLVIHYDRDRAVYRYQLIDWSGDVPEEAASNRLLQTPSQAVESLVQQLSALARGAMSWDADTTLDWLKGQGIALWREFIPDVLQQEFWARRDKITRMTIITSGDPVPWELLYPFSDPDHDAGFLIDQFPVARRLGRMPPHQLRVAPADVVFSGAESLAAAPGEVQALTALLGAHDIPITIIADVPELRRLLQHGNFGLLHFTCHNAFAPGAPNASQIKLGSQPFEPVFLEQHAGRFATVAPLVFMNACRTDGQAPLYTTIDGWALSFLRAGVGAFVGSLWEVVDSSASTYVQEFYRAALSGDTLGEAARKAREAIRQEPGDPTWLAYTLYGDPGATVR